MGKGACKSNSMKVKWMINPYYTKKWRVWLTSVFRIYFNESFLKREILTNTLRIIVSITIFKKF